MSLYNFKEHQYENISVGCSIESKATGAESTLLTPTGQVLLSSGFVPVWRIGELILGHRDNKFILLGADTHQICETDVPVEKIDCLAYAGRFSVGGRVVDGRRIILSYACQDLADVLYTNRADISDILERVKNGEQGIQ